MHSEVVSDKPGRCPKCGMKLVIKGSVSSALAPVQNSYTPLFVIIGLIALSSLTVVYVTGLSFANWIKTFMIGFFLVFSGFKLVDIKGFAEGYSTYDLLAKRIYGYGFVYPFIELFFAIAMILNFSTTFVLWTEVVVMAFSGLGVALKLARHEKFHCACLGTFLKVPLTYVTLVEDFGMAALALFLLFVK